MADELTVRAVPLLAGYGDYGASGKTPPQGVPGFAPDAYDALLQAHAEVGGRYAALWAEYGPGGLLDNRRKAFLASLAAKVRTRAAEAGMKVTEAFIEEQAHASTAYSDWMTAQETGRLTFQLTALELERIHEQLRHLDLCARRGF